MKKITLRKNFCVFIISYGRADDCKTAGMLQKYGYRGPWYVVCSTDDSQLPKYKKQYGEKVIVFDKSEIGKTFDRMDNLTDMSLGVYARQACFPIAVQLGYRYFLSLDDDYHSIVWRFPNNSQTKFCMKSSRCLDEIFETMLCFLDVHPKLWEVDFSVAGDFIGGVQNKKIYKDLFRKGMNSHFNDTQKYIRYQGAMNDDVNAYLNGWRQGRMFFSTPLLCVNMELTQGSGGMSEAYIDTGTYRKSFYSVMLEPSIVQITVMGRHDKRIHHVIQYNRMGAKILHRKWKKTI